jgi:hypothetical protein
LAHQKNDSRQFEVTFGGFSLLPFPLKHTEFRNNLLDVSYCLSMPPPKSLKNLRTMRKKFLSILCSDDIHLLTTLPISSRLTLGHGLKDLLRDLNADCSGPVRVSSSPSTRSVLSCIIWSSLHHTSDFVLFRLPRLRISRIWIAP